MDSEIQDYLRRAAAAAGRTLERVGPFLVTCTEHSDNAYLNYAMPDDHARPSSTDVAALVAAFHRHDRTPRLEYMPSAAPSVASALIAHGFEIEALLPVLTCSSDSLIDGAPVQDVELIVPSTNAEYRAVGRAIGAAYGASVEERSGSLDEDEDGQRIAGPIDDIYVLARSMDTGRPVGGGMCSSPSKGFSEIASIGVIAEFRRRGLGRALAVRLAREAFAVGVATPFLMAAHEAELRIYTRAGFSKVGEILHISDRRPRERTSRVPERSAT